MEGRFSVNRYRELIQRNEFLHRQLEPLFLELLSAEELSEFRPFLHLRLPALQADLELVAATPYPYPLVPPQLENAPQTLGGLYVLLGSHLGGRVIHKALKKNTQLREIPDFHFFAAGKSFPSREWPQFCRLLDQYVVTEEEMKAAAEGARVVFRFFHAVYAADSGRPAGLKN